MASSKCCDYHAGMLRHTIDIESRVITPTEGEDGGGDQSWPTFLSSVRASVKPTSGSEQWHSQQLKARITHEVVMRYRAGVTADMRVKFGTRYMNIHQVKNIEERNRWYVLMVEEGTPQ